jgi:hypothetical protein
MGIPVALLAVYRAIATLTEVAESAAEIFIFLRVIYPDSGDCHGGDCGYARVHLAKAHRVARQTRGADRVKTLLSLGFSIAFEGCAIFPTSAHTHTLW